MQRSPVTSTSIVDVKHAILIEQHMYFVSSFATLSTAYTILNTAIFKLRNMDPGVFSMGFVALVSVVAQCFLV
jgi:hypothetical protein